VSYRLVVVAMTRVFPELVVAVGEAVAAVATAVGAGVADVAGVELVHPARRITTKRTAHTDAINPKCMRCFIL